MSNQARSSRVLSSIGLVIGALGVLAVGTLGAVGGGIVRLATPPEEAIVMAPTPNVLAAVRDLSRLETLEMHFEKVVDLTDKQPRLFGLVQSQDTLLMITAVDVTLGVDLTKLRDRDVSAPDEAGAVRICLPEPEILSARLDEAHTRVHSRSTDVLAHRNEALEGEARRRALADVEHAVREGDGMDKARREAQRSLRTLATQLGVKSVEFACPFGA